MDICYIDESGGFEAPNQTRAATPLMALVGLIIRATDLAHLTSDFLHLKQQFFPSTKTRFYLDSVLKEVKGSELRANIRSGSRKRHRHSIRFLDEVVQLTETYDIRLIGRVWIKDTTEALKPRATYTFAIQDIGRHFNHYMAQSNESGIILCDGRHHYQDAQVAHSIFTIKHKATGDTLEHLAEASVFGRSENHVGLQLADIVASSLIYPMAARAYCAGHVQGVHVHPSFDVLRTRYGPRLRARQHLYRDTTGRMRGGIVVSDKLQRSSPKLLFRPPN